MASHLDALTTQFLQDGFLKETVGDLSIALDVSRSQALTEKLDEYRRRYKNITDVGDRTVQSSTLHDTVAKEAVLRLLLRLDRSEVLFSEVEQELQGIPRAVILEAFLIIAAYNAGMQGSCVQGGTGVADTHHN